MFIYKCQSLGFKSISHVFVQLPGSLPYFFPEVQRSVLVHQPAGVGTEWLHPADQQPERGTVCMEEALKQVGICVLNLFLLLISEVGHRVVSPSDITELLPS